MFLGKILMYIDILESNREIEKRINRSFVNAINKRIKQKLSIINRQIKDRIPSWISSQEEVISLSANGLQGSLNAQLGLVPGQAAIVVAQIIDAVANSIEIRFSGFAENFSGTLEVLIQPKDFTNLLTLSGGFIFNTSLADPSYYQGELHWLNWLLTKGDAVIVVGYTYIPENAGRSGGGTMQLGGSFRIDPAYSGTENDNFITRAFKNRDGEITSIFRKVL